MLGSRVLYKTVIFVVLLSCAAGISYGVDDDFGSARKIEGEYFTIYYPTDIDVSTLVQKLNIPISDAIITGKTTKKNSADSELADMVDTLFLRISDILDMQLYSFKGNLKICKDQNQLEHIYQNLFNKNLYQQKSFYVYSLETIYISADSFTREILGHEIGHAVISRYFVVLPSIKVQEILATFVEYQLRKE